MIIVRNHLDAPLTQTKTYKSDGRIKGNLPIRVLPGEAAYIKVQRALIGVMKVKGLLTFEIEEYDKKLCIFFCNPFIGYNRFGLFWKNRDKPTNRKLFQKLDGSASWKSYGLIEWHNVKDEENRIEVSGFMSQGDPAFLHVNVNMVNRVEVLKESNE